MINSIIVSYTHNEKTDISILCVGKKRLNKTVEVINAFQGDEATRLWNKLTTKKERTTDEKNSERKEEG